MSSKITQEFSLAVNFDLSSLKQSIIIVQGVLFVFALFNLQGAVFVAHRCQRVSLLILSQFVSFVKNFFQVFQTFFELFFQSSPSATFLFYHIFRSLSRTFFKFFSDLISLWCFQPPSGDLDILAQRPLFVKHFFTFSSPLFLILLI